jgi:hypothetical protein
MRPPAACVEAAVAALYAGSPRQVLRAGRTLHSIARSLPGLRAATGERWRRRLRDLHPRLTVH